MTSTRVSARSRLRAAAPAATFVATVGAAAACSTPNYGAQQRTSMNYPPHSEFDGDIKFDEKVGAIPLYRGLPDDGSLVYDEDKGVLIAGEGSGYTVHTRVQLNFPRMENPALIFWFYKYRPEQKWRKGLCYWQVPLMWVTLGIWGIVPLNYPCHDAIWHTGALREIAGEDKRMEILEFGLKAEAHRVGANAVVLAFIADQAATGWLVTIPEG